MTAHRAPCGHAGEVIVGTYVRCAEGCEGAIASRRGEPGHVDACACPRCKVRRAAAAIVYRAKDGREVARVQWDGVAGAVEWLSAITAPIRHWVLVDAEGAELLRGATPDMTVHAGMSYCSAPSVMLDQSLQLSVTVGLALLAKPRAHVGTTIADDLAVHRIHRAIEQALDQLKRYALCDPQERGMAVLASFARSAYICAGGTREEADHLLLNRRELDLGVRFQIKFQIKVTVSGMYWAGQVDVATLRR